MADTKISALTGASTPLAGTEVVPLVQSSTTKKVAVSDLTAGRAVSAASYSATGNVSANLLQSNDSGITVNGVAYFDANKIIRGVSGLTYDGTTLATTSITSLNGAVVVNESGADVDMRVEGDTDTNLLFVDASTDRIGVGTSTPNGKFDVLLSADRHLTTKFDTNITLSAENNNGNPENVRFYGENIRMYTPQGGFTAANLTLGAELFSTTGNFKLYTGNVVIGTAGKGIDFSADSHAAGMTSELLDDYEEGTWTPALGRTTGGLISATYETQTGKYTKVGNQVVVNGIISITAISSQGTDYQYIGGLPFNPADNSLGAGSITRATATTATSGYPWTDARLYLTNAASGLLPVNANFTTGAVSFTLVYFV